MSKHINIILAKLHEAYDEPKTELQNWKTPFEFAVCVILSAQATDKGVNKVTEKLFAKYKSVDDFASANLEELQDYVKSINYYKTKAKRIIDAAVFVQQNFVGKLPQSIDELTKIPGIGRKSANVILQEAFGKSQGVVVDTHVTRVTHRLGINPYNDQKDAVKIESVLKKQIPKTEWQFFSGATVLHGRYVCVARKPKCAECNMNRICPSAEI